MIQLKPCPARDLKPGDIVKWKVWRRGRSVVFTVRAVTPCLDSLFLRLFLNRPGHELAFPVPPDAAIYRLTEQPR